MVVLRGSVVLAVLLFLLLFLFVDLRSFSRDLTGGCSLRSAHHLFPPLSPSEFFFSPFILGTNPKIVGDYLLRSRISCASIKVFLFSHRRTLFSGLSLRLRGLNRIDSSKDSLCVTAFFSDINLIAPHCFPHSYSHHLEKVNCHALGGSPFELAYRTLLLFPRFYELPGPRAP